MLRYGLAFATLALMGAVLTIPNPNPAEAAGFRPAFTGGPFRIVVPGFGPRFHGRPGPHGPSKFLGPVLGGPHHVPPTANFGHPATHTVAEGLRSFRILRHRQIGGYSYPVTIGTDGSFYGAPYDPSDEIPVYGPVPVGADAPLGPVLSQIPALDTPRGCRAERVIVPAATGGGEGEITIVRC